MGRVDPPGEKIGAEGGGIKSAGVPLGFSMGGADLFFFWGFFPKRKKGREDPF